MRSLVCLSLASLFFGCTPKVENVTPETFCERLSRASCDALTRCCAPKIEAGELTREEVDAACAQQREQCAPLAASPLFQDGRVTIDARALEAAEAKLAACEVLSPDDLVAFYDGHVEENGACGEEQLSAVACAEDRVCVEARCVSKAQRGERCEELPCVRGLQCAEVPGEGDSLVRRCIGMLSVGLPCRHSSECAGSCVQGSCVARSETVRLCE